MNLEAKTEKLVTAIFMVTDFMERDEPIRQKLRLISLDLLTDILTGNLSDAIMDKREIITLINIAKTINLISPMNTEVLLREINKTKNWIEEKYFIKLEGLGIFEDNDVETGKSSKFSPTSGVGASLTPEVFPNFEHKEVSSANVLNKNIKDKSIQSRNTQREDVGLLAGTGGKRSVLEEEPELVEGDGRGPTLRSLSALKEPKDSVVMNGHQLQNNIKNIRQESIIEFIKDNGPSTIKDIVNGMKLAANISRGEKTIQRELVSLMKDGVLKKEGEKRWSKYSLK